jgi:hypothetical protein
MAPRALAPAGPPEGGVSSKKERGFPFVRTSKKNAALPRVLWKMACAAMRITVMFNQQTRGAQAYVT